MNSEEETGTTRVTRGALRRRSVDQDPASAPVTPKKPATSKKVAVLDAIQEGNNGVVDSEDTPSGTTRATRAKKDTPLTMTNKAVQKLKDREEKGGRRSRTSSLTEENLASLEPSSAEVRRTPRRRASQDVSLTPQTALSSGRRLTRRNSVASDDAPVSAFPATTPKASTSRLSVASTIAEDDEKEVSTTKLDAQSPDKSVRKLRGRSVSISPVPKVSSTAKNTSINSQKTDDGDASPRKEPRVLLEDIRDSPRKSVTDLSSGSVILVEAESDDQSPDKSKNTSVTQKPASVDRSGRRLSRNVTFDEQDVSDRQNQSAYPKTPIPASGEKRFKFSAKDSNSEEKEKIKKSTPEMFDVDESPDETEPEQTSNLESSQVSKKESTTGNEEKQAPSLTKSESSGALNESIDSPLVEIVEDVRKSINRADMSMNVLETPNKGKQQKSHGGEISSTPIAKPPSVGTPLKEQLQKIGSPKFVSHTPDGRGTQKKVSRVDETKLSKSWSQAVKGKANDKGIDVFSIRKQEQQRREEEEVEKLNKEREESSRKRKSAEMRESDEEQDEEEEDEDEEVVASQRSMFVDDEAMEVDDDYKSGDSLDSETRAEMEQNEIPIDGESIGSQDDDDDDDDEDDDEGENDSFIVADDEEPELLDESDEEISEAELVSSDKKKRKRIIEQEDSSEEERNLELSQKEKSISLNKTNATDENDTSRIEINSSLDASKAESLVEKNSSESTAKHVTPAKSMTKISDSSKSPASSKSSSKTASNNPTNEATPSKTSPSNLTKKEPGENMNEPQLGDEVSSAKKSSKERKSLPALISADFYASSAKKAKRATINALASAEEEPQLGSPNEEAPKKAKQSKLLVSNPAALALAKKNNRLSLDATVATSSASQTAKRMSLPGKFMKDEETKNPSKKSKDKKEPESNGLSNNDEQPADVEMMEVDEEYESNGVELKEASTMVVKQKPKDLSEFNHDAILSRCNEIVRADKERKQQSATMRQKKKDEKRNNRVQEKQAESTEGDDSMEQQKKKKKKKKKQVNYLLEELGETKEEQLARALKRKMALLDAKRERKRAKKAAKLQQQLNKENQHNGEEKQQGIGAKFEKKAKKKQKQKQTTEATKVNVAPSIPVSLNISAYAVYRSQIEELKQAENQNKMKGKRLKENNLQTSAAQEVAEALQPVSKVVTKSISKVKVDAKPESEERPTKSSNLSENNLGEARHDDIEALPTKEKNRSKKNEKAAKILAETDPKKISSIIQDQPEKVPKKEPSAKKVKKAKIPEETLAPKEPQVKRIKTNQSDGVCAEPIASLDDEFIKLKKIFAKPLEKAAKKQKLSPKKSLFNAEPVPVELTPPRKGPALLKALHFQEEAVTPEQKLLKRNHGFKEEPVTPKPIGFKVSNLLTGDREELRKQGNRKKAKLNRSRPEDVKEPSKMLPQPIWTQSGSFVVEPVEKRRTKSGGDYIPLNVNGGGDSRKHSTEFLLKSLGPEGKDGRKHGHKAARIDTATVSRDVINFKRESIFDRNPHLREKKPKQ